MFIRIFYFLCLFPLFLLGSILDPAAYVSQGPAASWVKFHEIPLDDVPVKPSQINVQYLLIEKQRNWEEKTTYRHLVMKALTQNGVNDLSKLAIDFDPLHYKIIVHNIAVFRNGKWEDRLNTAKQEILQREAGLEESCYDGGLTLVYFLRDIREGDIIDSSYSVIGEHPLWKSHYMDEACFQKSFSVEKISYRFLAPPSFSFSIKCFNTNISPQVTDISSSLCEWLWETTNTTPCKYKSDQPDWYNPYAYIQMSQFTSWREVVQKIYPLYQLPADFANSVPSGMQDLVDEWKALTQDPHERALLALRFVQDEIRYLSLINGINPHSPFLTFEHRFGDCKDKSFLLHALLHLMDISSTPLLVHSTEGKNLPESLPLLYIFDHAAVQVEIEGQLYYVDPTISFQGGSLQTNYFPNYEWGLLIAPDTEALVALPKSDSMLPIEMESSFILESEDSACLTIKSVFYDSCADRVRCSLEHNGVQSLVNTFLSEMQQVYGGGSLEALPEVIDDRQTNRLTLLESYRVPTQKLSDKKVLKLYSYILRHSLGSKVNPVRDVPYEIEYPLWVKEHIHIENPFNKWKSCEEVYTQEHESFIYSLSTHIKGHHAHFDIELKHLQDHIPQSSLQEYWNIIDDIEWNSLPRLTISSSKS